MDRTFKIMFFGIFMFVGTIFFAVSLIFKNYYFSGMENCITTKGTITNITEDNTIVEYYVKGQTYTQNFSYYNSALRIGEKIDVCYDKYDINHAILKNEFSFILNIFKYIGISLLIVPILIMIVMEIIKKQKMKIKETGLCESFEISSVEENNYVTINNAHPYQIVVKTVINGYEVTFKSENIMNRNIREILAENNIYNVFVYYDPENFKKYYVDIEEIKKLLK